jgi:hypothetical protein
VWFLRLARIHSFRHFVVVPLTEKEFEAKYPLIMGWIQQTLADHKSKARMVASLGFKRLSQYFSPELLAYAKVIYVDVVPTPPLSKIGLNQFSDFENMKADGITYLDTFFARQEVQRDEPLHFHELVHVVQWKLLGAKPFVAAYADGLERFGYRNSPLEVMAYDAQAAFEKSSQPFDVEKLVKSRLQIGKVVQ